MKQQTAAIFSSTMMGALFLERAKATPPRMMPILEGDRDARSAPETPQRAGGLGLTVPSMKQEKINGQIWFMGKGMLSYADEEDVTGGRSFWIQLDGTKFGALSKVSIAVALGAVKGAHDAIWKNMWWKRNSFAPGGVASSSEKLELLIIPAPGLRRGELEEAIKAGRVRVVETTD